MTETTLKIKASFDDPEKTSGALSSLEVASSKHEYNFYQTLNSLDPVENCLIHDVFDIESFDCNGIDLSIHVLTGRLDEFPGWFVAPLLSMGAILIKVTAVFDEGADTIYFVKGDGVSKKVYAESRKALVSSLESKAPKLELFLPKGKVKVIAKVEEIQTREGSWENYRLLRMTTDDGDEIFYRGNSSKMIIFAKQKRIKRIGFIAIFEKGELDGRNVSFAKRPSKIEALFS